MRIYRAGQLERDRELARGAKVASLHFKYLRVPGYSILSSCSYSRYQHFTISANLLNLTHDSIFVRDMYDVITYWNRAAEDLYGWTPEEAVGKVTHQLLHTIFPAPIDEIRAELLRTGR